MSILDAFFGMLDITGALWPGTRRRLPSRGTQLRVRKPVRLHGRDLRPDSLSVGFLATLPSQTIVRVEDLAGEDGAGLWVRPVLIDMLAIVPAECRAAAAAYGYVLEIAPGIMTEFFETLR